jgi:hypothetical protein
VLDAEVSELRRELKRLTAAFNNAFSSHKFSSGVFESADDNSVLKISEVGLPGDSERRRMLIDWAQKFECGVDFEFLDVDCGSALPSKTVRSASTD